VSERFPPEESDEITRRQWLLRLGEMVVLAGVSGVVPEFILAPRDTDTDNTGTLPPGLYAPSPDHLVHALESAGKLYVTPPGSETDYVQPSSLPFQPQFFSHEQFGIVTRFVEIVLGKLDANALAQTTQWLDLWFYSAANVMQAARQLDSLHRLLAVAFYGEPSVVELETSDLQAVAREGLRALHEISVERHSRGFLELSNQEQVDLIVSTGAAKPDSPLRRFFDVMRREAIRGYYTSAEGLKELDYKGNAYYPDSPGCPANQGRISHRS